MFFEDIQDFKKYCSVNASFDFDEMSVYLKDVDRTVLKKYLGKDFLAELQEAFDDGILKTEDPDEDEEKTINAIELIRQLTPNFALVKWAPSGQLSISDSGIRIASNDNYKTAWEWQVKEVVRSWRETGTAALDELLEFLDANVELFDTYADSDEFKSNKELFVNTSKVFVKYFSGMSNSRSAFDKLQSIIRKVEEMDVKGVLLPDYFAELKEKVKAAPLSGSQSGEEHPEGLNDADKKAMEFIQPAVVHLTIARAVKELSAGISEEGFLQFDNTASGGTMNTRRQADGGALFAIGTTAEKDGRAYLRKLSEYLEAHKEDYPTFADDEEYDAPTDESSVDPNATLFNGL